MIISKNLEWVRDYISEVEHLVPKVKYLKRISGREASETQIQRIHGIFTYADGRNYRIMLYTTRQVLSEGKIRPYNTVELLGTLAHELSHMLDLNHTPERMKLECAIMTQFMIKLARDGYISEEQEAKDGLFYKTYE